MRFYTATECETWCQRQGIPLDDQQRPIRAPAFPHRLRCNTPASFTKLMWFSRCVESALQPRQDCLLWVTASQIWTSSENEHLYYRLRQSYGDFRLLGEAPGHLCLGHERPELVTLIYLCILFGWDAHLMPTVGYGQAFICHDEWLEIGFADPGQCTKTRQAFEHAKLAVLLSDAKVNPP